MTGDRGFKPGVRQREPARLYYCRAEWDWFVGTRALGTLRQIRAAEVTAGRERVLAPPGWRGAGRAGRSKALVIAAVELAILPGRSSSGSHRRLPLIHDGPEGPARAYPMDTLPAIMPIRIANQRALDAYLKQRGRA